MGKIKALFFDQDGVIIDTERDGHRVSFNMTFKEFGFTDEWSVDYYHELLQIAGGKERMKHHLETRGFSKILLRHIGQKAGFAHGTSKFFLDIKGILHNVYSDRYDDKKSTDYEYHLA